MVAEAVPARGIDIAERARGPQVGGVYDVSASFDVRATVLMIVPITSTAVFVDPPRMVSVSTVAAMLLMMVAVR
jgi:hypothetical protein